MTLPARYLLPRMPASLEGLEELALDMHWSWSHSADAIWRTINEELWQRTRNPWLLLIDISDARLQRLASDRDFTELVQHELARFQAATSAPGWFEQQACADELGQVAYFCMEFGLCEALPIYSGGLGMLAGDTLKTASDLGVPRDRGRPALPAGLLSPDARQRGPATRPLSLQRSDTAARRAILPCRVH